MPIILINGANGHGKGQLAIKMILDYEKANDALEKEGQPRRPIFANIYGINEDGNKPLKDVSPIPSDKVFFGKQDDPLKPPPEGYFIPPIGSIFFYDEAQDIEWSKRSRNALSDDPRVTSLETHRHAGLDVIFLTQSTNYIHSHITGLVAPHYYVERPLGLATTNVFMFNKFQKSPDSVTTRSKADDHFMIKLGKKYGQYYKSSAQNNIKANIPLKAKILVSVFVLILIYTAYSFYKGSKAKEQKEAKKASDVAAEVVNNPSMPNVPVSPTASPDGLTPSNLLNKYLPSIVSETAYYEDIRSAMVIESSSDCKVLNKYGERLNISTQDCFDMSSDPTLIPRSRIESDYKQAAYSGSNSPSFSSSNGSEGTTSVNPYPEGLI